MAKTQPTNINQNIRIEQNRTKNKTNEKIQKIKEAKNDTEYSILIISFFANFKSERFVINPHFYGISIYENPMIIEILHASFTKKKIKLCFFMYICMYTM